MTSNTKIHLAAGTTLFLSGAAALIYQSLWMRSFGLVFGNTTMATSIVLAVFMGGLALGGYVCRKYKFENALKVYAISELMMGCFAVLGRLLLVHLPATYAALLGHGAPAGWAELPLKAGFVTAITLPTAVFAGMTLPLLAESLSRRGQGSPGSFAFLYRVNTFGAAFGAIASAYLLIPSLGTETTCALAAAANLMIGVIAWKLSVSAERTVELPSAGNLSTALRSIPWLAFGAGLSSFLLEVVWVRSLVLVIGSSSYSFSIMLGSILLGIALGAWIYSWILPKIHNTKTWLAWTYLGLAALILLSYAVMGKLPDLYMNAIEHFGHSFLVFQTVDFLLSFFTLLLVALPQGFLFPALLALGRSGVASDQKKIGSLYLWNTLGALTGSLGAGLVLIPQVGFRPVYLTSALVAACMGLWLLAIHSTGRGKVLLGGLLIAVTILLFKFYEPWDPVLMSMGVYENGFKLTDKKSPKESLAECFYRSGYSLVYYAEGRESVVSVVRSANGSLSLANNGKFDASDGGDLGTQKLLAHIPFAHFPQARRVYLIGWGSGSTAGSAALYPIADLHCVEIEPKDFDTADWFKAINFEVWKDPRFHIRFNDARNDLLVSPGTYDLIISEPPNPWIAGVSNLFTREFYELAKSRLEENGIFAQWLPYYRMSLADIQLQLRTFCRAFPETQVWTLSDPRKPLPPSGNLLLIGARRKSDPDYREVVKTFQNKAIAADLAKIGIGDPWALLSLQLLDRDEMLAFAGEGPDNTDAYPRIEFSTPRSHFRTVTVDNDSSQTILKSLISYRRKVHPEVRNSPLDDPRVGKVERARDLTALAGNYSNLSLLENSFKLVEELRAMGVENSETEFILGSYLTFSKNDIEGGIKRLEHALKMDPKNKDIYYFLAPVYAKANQLDAAFELLSKGYRRWPDDLGFLFDQALVKDYQRDLPAAKTILERVLTIDPSYPSAKSLYISILSGKYLPLPSEAVPTKP